MVQYRRSQTPGGTYFFTVNLRDRGSRHLGTHIDRLRQVFRDVQQRRRPCLVSSVYTTYNKEIMSGLSGLLFGLGATVVAFILWILVVFSFAVTHKFNMRYFYAVSAGLLTMLAFVVFVYIVDEVQWIHMPTSYYDAIGPTWAIAAAIITIYRLRKAP